jgi:hypothetical protein
VAAAATTRLAVAAVSAAVCTYYLPDYNFSSYDPERVYNLGSAGGDNGADGNVRGWSSSWWRRRHAANPTDTANPNTGGGDGSGGNGAGGDAAAAAANEEGLPEEGLPVLDDHVQNFHVPPPPPKKTFWGLGNWFN